MNDATAFQATPAVRAYLRRATWGLPREKQQEVWDELEEHLLGRAAQLQAGGATPTEALNRALAELGSPGRVSSGMTGVYLMPKLILIAGAGALTLSAALYALAGGSQGNTLTLPVLTRPSPSTLCAPAGSTALQLPVISRQGKLTCYRTAISAVGDGALVSLSNVRTAVSLYGGTAETRPNDRLEIQMPGQNWSRSYGGQQFGGESFIRASGLFDALVNLPPRSPETKTTLSGYDHPVLKVGVQGIQFGSGSAISLGDGIYRALAGQVIASAFYPNKDSAFSFDTSSAPLLAANHRVQTELSAGSVVTLIKKTGKYTFYVETAEVGVGGMMTLRTAQQKLRFVSNPSQLGPIDVDGRTPVLLIRVTDIPLDNLKSGIFLPKQTTSDARSTP